MQIVEMLGDLVDRFAMRRGERPRASQPLPQPIGR
jgi:hypothetical protein